jgi:serine/threonine protein kinase
MEFVEGETLEHLIRRSGRIEMQSALDITTQVATGLAAVHEQNLVHWDIKPSNIMVNQNGAYYLNRNNHTGSQLSQVDVHNPNTNCTSTAVLPLDDLPPSPRQFQKLVFSQAQGDENTLSAGKTNLCTTWKEFLADVEKMPVVEYSELHIDNSDEGWLE